jgi:excisionase family DNA binding protein
MLASMASPASLHTGDAAELVTPEQAADILLVAAHAVRKWISEGSIPYLRTEGGPREQYLIPLQGMLSVLCRNPDIAEGLTALDEHVREAGLSEAELKKVLGGS